MLNQNTCPSKCFSKGGFTFSLTTLILLLLAVLVVFILVVSLHQVMKAFNTSSESSERKAQEQIHTLLPFILGRAVNLSKKKKFPMRGGIYALRVLFYLLLSFLIATALILAIMEIKKEGTPQTPNFDDKPKKSIICSQECALKRNYDVCYDQCMQSEDIKGD